MATIKIKGTEESISKFIKTNRLYIKRNSLIIESDIINKEETYKAVIKFITWYNLTKD